jgi:anti-sigma factor RsiW
VIDKDAAARTLIMAKLAQSRAELRNLFDPPRPEGGGAVPGARRSEFPRSRTMQALMSSRGLGALGAVAGGLLIARPAMALRLLRMVPASAVARILIAKAVASLKSKPHDNGQAQ